MHVLYKNLNIDKLRTTAFHPQTDGLVERVNRTLKGMLASYTNDNPTEWDTFLPYLTFAYNTSVQTSTAETPHYLLFGCDPIEPQDVMTLTRYRFIDDYNMIFLQHLHDARELARTHLLQAQTRQKHNYDKTKTSVQSFDVGHNVLLQEMSLNVGKQEPKFTGPYTIVTKLSEHNYTIKLPNSNVERVVNVKRLKLWPTRPEHLTRSITPDLASPSDKPPTNIQQSDANNGTDFPKPDTVDTSLVTDNQDKPIVKRPRGRPRKNQASSPKPKGRTSRSTDAYL